MPQERCTVIKEKTVALSILSALIGTLIIVGGINIFDDDAYYCEDREIVMRCDRTSAYYGLTNGKCWNKDDGNKLCRSGWLKIEKGFQPAPLKKTQQWLCSPDGCEPL